MSWQLLGLLFLEGKSCHSIPVLLSHKAGLQLLLDGEAKAASAASGQSLTYEARAAWLWDFVAELDVKPSCLVHSHRLF